MTKEIPKEGLVAAQSTHMVPSSLLDDSTAAIDTQSLVTFLGVITAISSA